MKILITGGCGFLGSNLAMNAIKNGYELIIFDNLSRYGSSLNFDWLKTIGNFTFVHGDIRNRNDVFNLIKKHVPDAVFHLAGQVAMTTSISDPILDFETNALGTFNLLEGIRRFSNHSKVIYSSTNKVYGDFSHLNFEEKEFRYKCMEYPNGFPETISLDFHSPYGCSKGSADQYMLDYHRIHGLQTVVFRHSSMYGGRQFSTVDQGWIGWFCQQALNMKNNADYEPFTISGNGKQVRDVLHAEDMIDLYYSALDSHENIVGQVFNIGGGLENSLSLLELFQILEEKLSIKLRYKELPPRESDQLIFMADLTKIQSAIHWIPKISSKEGVHKMVDWLAS